MGVRHGRGAHRGAHRPCWVAALCRFAYVAVEVWCRVSLELRVGPGAGQVRSSSVHLRHPRLFAAGAPDCRTSWGCHGGVSHRTCAPETAAADRYGHRNAGGGAKRDLRHVGNLRPDSLAPGPPVRLAQTLSRLSPAISGADLRGQHARGGNRGRDHDPADHHLDLTRDPAVGAQPPKGSGLRPRSHAMGGP